MNLAHPGNVRTSRKELADMPSIQSLRVESGESAVLSPKSQLYKENYRQVRPRTAKEVREVIGLSEGMAKTMREQDIRRPQSMNLPAVVAAADLDSSHEVVRARALDLTHTALREYVLSANPSVMTHMEPALERYLDIAGLILNIVTFEKTIEVADGATLTISEDTHVLEVSRIIIHGTGKINCSGFTKFNVDSVEGV
jgi:hypothetical protein